MACSVGIIEELLKNDSLNVKIASAVKVTLAVCACCLLLPKNSRFLCLAPPFLFLSHSLSFSCLSSLICCFSPPSCIFFSPIFSPLRYYFLNPYIIYIFLAMKNRFLPLYRQIVVPSILSHCLPLSFPNFLFLFSLSTHVFCVPPNSRMTDFSEEPRFTIEQIDLLQRLRRTGMTKQEILHALDTLDRLDREHGDKFGRRTSSSSSTYLVGANNSASNTSATSFNNNTTASATTTSSATCNGSNSGERGDHSTAAASSTTSKISTATQTQLNSAGGLSPSPSNSYDTSPPPGPPPPSAVLPSPVALVALSQNGRDSLAATPNGKLSPPRYPVNSAAASRAFGFEAAEEDLDIDDKVEELMR